MTEDELELLQRRLIENVTTNVEDGLKRRFTWLGAVALFITSGALYFMIQGLLASTTVRLETATRIQEMANTRLIEAADRAQEMTETAQAIRGELEEELWLAEVRLRELDQRADSLASELNTATQDNLGVSNELRSEVVKLLSIIEMLVSDPEQNADAAILARVDTIRNSLVSSQEVIDDAISHSDQFLSDFRDVMRGTWQIDNWRNQFGAHNTGMLLVDNRIDEDTFEGTFYIESESGHSAIQQVTITVDNENVVMDGSVIEGFWNDDYFTFSLDSNARTLIGHNIDSADVSADVTLRKVE